jgi:hypothetical protein
VHVETFPGDGTSGFGTLHGNRGWTVDSLRVRAIASEKS